MDKPSVYALALDENRLFSSGSDGEIKEWDPNSGEFRQMTIVLVRAKSLEISPAVGDFYGTEIDILADCTDPKFGQHRDHLHCTAK